MNQESRDCIFLTRCTSQKCDMSCAKNTMSELLLEKSAVPKQSNCYATPKTVTDKYSELVKQNSGSLLTLEVKDPQLVADSITYTEVCEYCEGHGASVSVYQLKYSKYIQALKDSWSQGVSGSLKETQAFCNTAKVLVISGLDFVMYSDFECQTLLTLFQDRARPGLSTVVVLSNISSLVTRGNSPFYEMLKTFLERGLRK